MVRVDKLCMCRTQLYPPGGEKSECNALDSGLVCLRRYQKAKVGAQNKTMLTLKRGDLQRT